METSGRTSFSLDEEAGERPGNCERIVQVKIAPITKAIAPSRTPTIARDLLFFGFTTSRPTNHSRSFSPLDDLAFANAISLTHTRAESGKEQFSLAARSVGRFFANFIEQRFEFALLKSFEILIVYRLDLEIRDWHRQCMVQIKLDHLAIL